MKTCIGIIIGIMLFISNFNITFAKTKDENIYEIKVSTSAEFMDAIESNKKIILSSGVYDLSEIEEIHNSKIKIEYAIEGEQLIIENIENLIIEGEEDVYIRSSNRGGNVLNFYKCSNITINNIKISHSSGAYENEGGVFSFVESKGVKLNNCKIFNSGSIAMVLKGVENFIMNSSSIENATVSAIVIIDSEIIHIKNSSLHNNNVYGDLISIKESNFIALEECMIESNEILWSSLNIKDTPIVFLYKSTFKNNKKLEYYIYDDYEKYFFTIKKSKVFISECSLESNEYDALTNNSDVVMY